MAKKVLFSVVGLLLIVGGLAGVKMLQFKTMAAAGANASDVDGSAARGQTASGRLYELRCGNARAVIAGVAAARPCPGSEPPALPPSAPGQDR